LRFEAPEFGFEAALWYVDVGIERREGSVTLEADRRTQRRQEREIHRKIRKIKKV
jgi:hypothetical protein